MSGLLDQSLEELEHDRWPDPEWQSGLVLRVHQLRRKPIGQLTTGDLKIMISQNVGLRYLIPLALKIVEQNPLTEGDYFAGDLLQSLVNADSLVIQKNLSLYRNVLHVIQKFKATIEANPELRSRLLQFEERISIVTNQH